MNFDVEDGDAVGIIGRNGAGKSTLLKILSRVTTPTAGRVKIKGKIASLLEVGTGFHPELTGRENIFLNGAILGMKKRDIKRYFDEIVDFSGVNKYIDTPVKRYSSGMYVRLAFAVAAHLDSEILIVDEVLAVGDAEFQKKALGKIKSVSNNQGRTVLFVSHHMQSISAITNKCILLKNGQIVHNGTTADVVNSYYKENFTVKHEYVSLPTGPTPKVIRVAIETSHPGNIHNVGERFTVQIEIYNPAILKSAVLSYQIFNSNNQPVIHVLNLNSEIEFCTKTGIYTLISDIPKLRLYPDNYYLTVYFSDHITKTKFEVIEGICFFEVKVLGVMRDYYWRDKQAVYVEDTKWDVIYNRPLNELNGGVL